MSKEPHIFDDATPAMKLVREIAYMKKEGDGATDDDDGYVMENEDNFEVLCSLIRSARDILGVDYEGEA